MISYPLCGISRSNLKMKNEKMKKINKNSIPTDKLNLGLR
jgi:hypothetical protein